jgi:hypothetical protein
MNDGVIGTHVSLEVMIGFMHVWQSLEFLLQKNPVFIRYLQNPKFFFPFRLP